MENNAIQKLLSKFVLDGAKIIAHISYWSGKFETQTKEDLDKQKSELKEYPVIIYNWNEKAKNILKYYASNSILADFIHNDEILIALKDVDINCDNGYYSVQTLSSNNEYDPATEQFSIKSPLTIIRETMEDKINAIKSCADKMESLNKRPDNRKLVTIIELLKKNNGGLEVYVNKDYSKPFPPRSYTSENNSWNKIFEIAKNKRCNNYGQFVKYFNSSPVNPLYTTLGYEKTKILEEKNGIVTPLIDINIITQEYITRSKGQRKKYN